MHVFKNDEDGYSKWHAEHPSAFVFNHFGGTNPAFNVLHRSKCSFLWREVDEGVRTVVEKWCAESESEIEQHANATLGYGVWKKCAVCHRSSDATRSMPLCNAAVAEETANSDGVWIAGEPAVWIGSGEKEWKEKLTIAFQKQMPSSHPQWIDVEFRFDQDRVFTKDIDNLLTPILESARDAGWLERGFARLGSVTANKLAVSEAGLVGALVTPYQTPPALPAQRTGLLIEAPLTGFDADTVKWTLYDKCLDLYRVRPELRYPPQSAITVEIRVTVSNVSRRKSLQALLKPCIDGLEPILGRPDNLAPEPREALLRRLAPQDEMITALAFHVRGGDANTISVLLN